MPAVAIGDGARSIRLRNEAAAVAIWTMGVMVGPISGPILGGWLTDHYSWRWVFYINVPFGVVTAIGLRTFLKETSHGNSVRLDWIGFGTLSLAIGSFQMMLDRGGTLDWFSSREIIIEACVAAVCFYLFLVQFALARRPFLSPRLFADVNFSSGLVLYCIMGSIMYATLALLVPYLQTLMNYPVVITGLVLAPRGAGLMLAAMICGPVDRQNQSALAGGHWFRYRSLCAVANDLLDSRHFAMGSQWSHAGVHPGDQYWLIGDSDQRDRFRYTITATTNRGDRGL